MLLRLPHDLFVIRTRLRVVVKQTQANPAEIRCDLYKRCQRDSHSSHVNLYLVETFRVELVQEPERLKFQFLRSGYKNSDTGISCLPAQRPTDLILAIPKPPHVCIPENPVSMSEAEPPALKSKPPEKERDGKRVSVIALKPSFPNQCLYATQVAPEL